MSIDDAGVLKLDLESLQPVATIATGLDPAGIAEANGSVWVTHAGDGSLARIDVV